MNQKTDAAGSITRRTGPVPHLWMHSAIVQIGTTATSEMSTTRGIKKSEIPTVVNSVVKQVVNERHGFGFSKGLVTNSFSATNKTII